MSFQFTLKAAYLTRKHYINSSFLRQGYVVTQFPKKYLYPRELPNVRYTGMCHRPGLFFTFKNPEQAPNFELFPEQALIFKVLLQNKILFDSLVSNPKNPGCFPQNDRSNPNFLFKKHAYVVVKALGVCCHNRNQ